MQRMPGKKKLQFFFLKGIFNFGNQLAYYFCIIFLLHSLQSLHCPPIGGTNNFIISVVVLLSFNIDGVIS